jgi:carnitine 3-dehydrogenase
MKAAIIGGGVIGGGWAARFLLNGWAVAVFDPDPEAARKIGAVLDNARHALPGLYDRALPAEGRLTFMATSPRRWPGPTGCRKASPKGWRRNTACWPGSGRPPRPMP